MDAVQLEGQWCNRRREVGVVSGVQWHSGGVLKRVQCREVVGGSEVQWNRDSVMNSAL